VAAKSVPADPPQSTNDESATTIAQVSELLNTGALKRIVELEAQLADLQKGHDAALAAA